MNEPQQPQKIPNPHPLHRRRYLLFLLLSFLAGCLVIGLFLNKQRFTNIGKLDKRYANQHARATETIGLTTKTHG